VFSPQQRAVARRRLGIDDAGPIVLFLSSAGITDARKGWDLLDGALARLRRVHPDIRALIVGPTGHAEAADDHANRIWAGTVTNDEDLAWHYAAADVVAVPSREDNMPLTAMEAQACGRAVVGFRIGGMPDIVEHGRTGILAATIDSELLADALEATLDDALGSDEMGHAARERAVNRWSDEPVVRGYLRVYEQARRQQTPSTDHRNSGLSDR
jgi:glycosyltransferase involved in cell wall biosynthesis